jgi:hypothetical protein
MSPTIRSDYETRCWFFREVMKLVPISKVRFEYVSGPSDKTSVDEKPKKKNGKQQITGDMTRVEQGQKAVIEYIKSFGIAVDRTKGKVTSERRKAAFGGKDPKVRDKSAKQLATHCLDSLVIAMGKESVNLKELDITTRVVYITKQVKNRRCLT